MGQPAEPAVLHEYRHLLRTASADWQESAHRHALWALGAERRAELLAGLHLLLLAGTRLDRDDVHSVARLMVLAERRQPGLLLRGLGPELVAALATAVVESPTGRLLRAGLDVWDGADPPARRDDPAEPDHHQRWHDQRAVPGYSLDEAWVLPGRPLGRRHG